MGEGWEVCWLQVRLGFWRGLEVLWCVGEGGTGGGSGDDVGERVAG